MNEVIHEEPGTSISGEVLESIPQQSRELVSEANPYMSMIETIVSRGGDMSNLDKILDLQIKWEANEARKAYVAAMSAFKAEPMEILKAKLVSFETRDGDTTSYRHAALSDVTDTVVPAMGKHGLSHRWDVKQEGGQITVTCTVTHALGHSESVSMTASPDSSGKKNAIQQVASANSYLQRYTLLAITGMATKDMDDDGRQAYNEHEEEVDQSWYDAIEAAADQHGLKGLKAEMVTKFGNTTNIPKALIRSYNEKWATFQPDTKAAA